MTDYQKRLVDWQEFENAAGMLFSLPNWEHRGPEFKDIGAALERLHKAWVAIKENREAYQRRLDGEGTLACS